MAKEKPEAKDWWSTPFFGEFSDLLRNQLNSEGVFPSDEELNEAVDKMTRAEILRASPLPERIIKSGFKTLEKMRTQAGLANLLSPTVEDVNAARSKYRARFIEERRLTPMEADRECVAGVIRRNPLLRAVRDASDWLDETDGALKGARRGLEDLGNAKDESTRKKLLDQISFEFSRAVSFAFHAGCSAAEIKGRLLHWRDSVRGNLLKPKITPLLRLAYEARTRLIEKNRLSCSVADILREILLEKEKVRKKGKGNGPHEYEHESSSGTWKRLPDFKRFNSTFSVWIKKYPDLGLFVKRRNRSKAN